MLRSTRFLGLASLMAITLASSTASAQTTTSTATVSQSGQLYPDRIVNGADFGSSTRAQNLNPFGVNYDDCVKDMTLRFTVLLSGFNGTSLEVWATNNGACTTLESRGKGTASGATCWMVNPGQPAIVASASTPITIDVKVRDLVGPQNTPPRPGGFGPTELNGELLGTKACTTQPSFLGVPMSIWFMPVDASGNVVGTPYQYGSTGGFVADLVGPPAPSGVSIADGDTFFTVNWTSNADSDTAGYDVFVDPIPGNEDASASSAATTVLYCPGADAASNDATVTLDATGANPSDSASLDASDSASPDASDGATADAGDDGSTDATFVAAGTSVDAGCYYINAGGPSPGGGGMCNDPILASSMVQDSGVVSTAVLDEAGNFIDGGVATGAGGISTIPSPYLLAGSTGVTVSDKSGRSYKVIGLKNGTTYNVVVAAIDGSGNVGPASQEQCDSPAPVNDFWSMYRSGGGGAGGGFCALEAVGEPARSTAGVALAGAICALLLRRRRANR